MQYKTITLSLIQSHPTYHRRLKSNRRLMAALDSYALELRDRHLAWADRLEAERPQDDPQSRRSAALELALAEVERLIAVEATAGETAEP
ncbi:MAG: hypothetical protein U0871_14990 [Gemmataceae bacterium]